MRRVELGVEALEPLVGALRASLEEDGYDVSGEIVAGAPVRGGNAGYSLSTFCQS